MKSCLCCLLLVSWGIGVYARAPYERERLYQQVQEEYLSFLMNSGGGERFWTFQGQTYCSTDGARWELAASRRGPSSTEEYLAEFAKQGICLRGHRGVYLDRSLYSVGIWCCIGFMSNGDKCFFHLDNQYPGGIPKTNW